MLLEVDTSTIGTPETSILDGTCLPAGSLSAEEMDVASCSASSVSMASQISEEYDLSAGTIVSEFCRDLERI